MSDEELPGGWATASIAQLTEFVTSGSRGWAEHYSDVGAVFLRVGNLDHDTLALDLADVAHVQPPAGAEGERTRTRPGDIVLSITAEVGMVDVVAPTLANAYVSQHLALLRPAKGLDSAAFGYSLLDPTGLQKAAKSAQYGVTKPSLSLLQVRGFTVPVPPVAEQRRIVAALDSYLSRLDDAIANLERARRNLGRYRASVLQAAVEGRLVPTEAELARADGRAYEPADALLARILTERKQRWAASGKRGKYEEPVAPDAAGLPDLPEGWCWASVDQLAADEPQSLCDGPFGSNLKSDHYSDAGPRVVRLQNIGDGRFNDVATYIPQAHFDTLTRHQVFAGDLVVASLGEVLPRACMVPSSLGPAIVKADCLRFKVSGDLADARYILTTLNSPPVRKAVSKRVHGIGRPRMGLGGFRETCVPLPPLAEQARIVAEVDRVLSVTATTEATISAQIVRVKRLRQSVLKWAFEGKLVDQDPADEPAAVLLERIRDGRDGTTAQTARAANKRQRKGLGVTTETP